MNEFLFFVGWWFFRALAFFTPSHIFGWKNPLFVLTIDDILHHENIDQIINIYETKTGQDFDIRDQTHIRYIEKIPLGTTKIIIERSGLKELSGVEESVRIIRAGGCKRLRSLGEKIPSGIHTIIIQNSGIKKEYYEYLRMKFPDSKIVSQYDNKNREKYFGER